MEQMKGAMDGAMGMMTFGKAASNGSESKPPSEADKDEVIRKLLKRNKLVEPRLASLTKSYKVLLQEKKQLWEFLQQNVLEKGDGGAPSSLEEPKQIAGITQNLQRYWAKAVQQQSTSAGQQHSDSKAGSEVAVTEWRTKCEQLQEQLKQQQAQLQALQSQAEAGTGSGKTLTKHLPRFNSFDSVKSLDAMPGSGEPEEQVEGVAGPGRTATVNDMVSELQSELHRMRDAGEQARAGMDARLAAMTQDVEQKAREVEGLQGELQTAKTEGKKQEQKAGMLQKKLQEVVQKYKQQAAALAKQKEQYKELQEHQSQQAEQLKQQETDLVDGASAKEVAAMEKEVSSLKERVAELEQEEGEKAAMLVRLKQEKQDAAKTAAVKAAALNAARQDSKKRKEQVEEFERTVAELKEEIKRLKGQVQGQEQAKATFEQAREKDLGSLRTQMMEEAEKARVEAEAANQKRETKMNEVVRDAKKKSLMSQQMMEAKDNELTQIKAHLRELEQEVASGGHTEKKFFEYAALQANREGTSLGTKERVGELEGEVEQLRGQIEKMKKTEDLHRKELRKLMRTNRREGVNMEYLKNVVQQYMQHRPGPHSPEQRSLALVISTLLEFSKQEKDVINAKESVFSSITSSLWGSSPKKMAAPPPRPKAAPAPPKAPKPPKAAKPPPAKATAANAPPAAAKVPPAAAKAPPPPAKAAAATALTAAAKAPAAPAAPAAKPPVAS